MKNTFILIIKGIIIGIGKILPGVSGAILAISLNVYDKGLDAITNFFNNVKKNSIFLIKIGIGISLGLVFFSKIIKYFIINFKIEITLLFIGLIIGGIPLLFKEVKEKKHYISSIVSFIIIIIISLLSVKNNHSNITFFNLVLAGFVDAIATIFPGVCGTTLLMLMGSYDLIITALSNVTNNLISSIKILVPFSIGMFTGIIIISKFINYCFRKYKSLTYAIIIGVVLSTTLILFLEQIITISNISEIIVSFILLITGYFILKIIARI